MWLSKTISPIHSLIRLMQFYYSTLSICIAISFPIDFLEDGQLTKILISLVYLKCLFRLHYLSQYSIKLIQFCSKVSTIFPATLFMKWYLPVSRTVKGFCFTSIFEMPILLLILMLRNHILFRSNRYNFFLT